MTTWKCDCGFTLDDDGPETMRPDVRWNPPYWEHHHGGQLGNFRMVEIEAPRNTETIMSTTIERFTGYYDRPTVDIVLPPDADQAKEVIGYVWSPASVRIKMPCGSFVDLTGTYPVGGMPCPCGNPRHWIYKTKWTDRVCAWRADDSGVHETACGNSFCFDDEFKLDGRYRYCPGCAGRIELAPPDPDDDEIITPEIQTARVPGEYSEEP